MQEQAQPPQQLEQEPEQHLQHLQHLSMHEQAQPPSAAEQHLQTAGTMITGFTTSAATATKALVPGLSASLCR